MVLVFLYPFDDAVLDVDNLVCLIGYSAFMGYDHDSHAFLFVQFLQDLHHFHGRLAVQGSGRFVGQDNLGFGDEGAGNGYTLLLSAGQFVRHVVCPVLQTEFVQVFQGQLVSFLPADSLVEERKRHILHGILECDEIERLEDESYHPVPVFGASGFAQVLDEGAVQVIVPRIVIVENSQYI